MGKVASLVGKSPIHLTSNTLIMGIIAIVALILFVKAIQGIIRIVAFVAFVCLLLFMVQSTNLVQIPIVKQISTIVEKVAPPKELWSEAKGYIDKANKINKAVNDLK